MDEGPLSDERLRQFAYDPHVCSDNAHRSMAVELIAARHRIAQLELALSTQPRALVCCDGQCGGGRSRGGIPHGLTAIGGGGGRSYPPGVVPYPSGGGGGTLNGRPIAAEALRLRKSGATFQEIADALAMSPSAAREFVTKAIEDAAKRGAEPLHPNDAGQEKPDV